MSTTTFDVLHIDTPAMPRGASIAAQLFARLAGWATGRPVVARGDRHEEANAVRRLAFKVQNTDPGFAADLYAAADRHEEGL